jgi:uncharacterized membrane protein YphA (DoxX/SURF4 family)
MAVDRQATGLALLRIFIGVFFLFQGIGKIRWFTDTSLLAGRFADWMQSAPPGSMSALYLERVAIPFSSIFARAVPLGEMGCGLAMLFGIWTPLFAFIAFFMALNFAVAGGAIFKYSFLTSGYGLPVLGSTLALAIGGVRLPWSIRGK